MNKKKRKQQQEELERQLNEKREEISILKKKSIKELIAPSGIDVSNIDHLEIISSTKRYARSWIRYGFRSRQSKPIKKRCPSWASFSKTIPSREVG